jgi:MOSC domain-containing protein YiiM
MTAARRAHVEAVCVGRAAELTFAGRSERTAIDKRPIDGRIEVGPLGLDGDEQADTLHHGGSDQALYAYGRSDADHWVAALAREIPPGAFGENLRVAGLEVSSALVGERWAIGDEVVVEVTAPRIPCRTFAGFWDVPDLVARFLSAGRPGAYLRVLEPGAVGAGDRIRIVERPGHDLTVADVMRIHTRDRHEAARLLEVDAIAARVRDWAERHLAGSDPAG